MTTAFRRRPIKAVHILPPVRGRLGYNPHKQVLASYRPKLRAFVDEPGPQGLPAGGALVVAPLGKPNDAKCFGCQDKIILGLIIFQLSHRFECWTNRDPKSDLVKI